MTVTEAEAWPLPLALVYCAVLLYVPQLAAVVGETTWTLALPPTAMLAKVQLSTFDAIEQLVLSGLSDHAMPLPVGSVSVNATLLAAPAPVLLIVIVNPI